MLKTGELFVPELGVVLVFMSALCLHVCVCVCVCVRETDRERQRMGSDPSQLVPKTGRHEAFHLVCKEAQWCKECAEELKEEEKQNQPSVLCL